MAKQLTVHNATINTAAVEVKTLTISGKQVTLAVFRQLREEQLIAKDGTLNGQPWGYVNYHPDKCDEADHRHYVWQRGDELLRSRVYNKPTFSPTVHLPEATRYLTALVNEWIHDRDQCPIEDDQVHDLRARGEHIKVYDMGSPSGFVIYAQVYNELLQVVRGRQNVEAVANTLRDVLRTGLSFGQPATEDRIQRIRVRQQDAEDAFSKARAAFQAIVDRLPGSTEELGSAMRAAEAAEAARRERHHSVRDELAALPQLFIAV
jgi:hypothetical protein